MSLQEEWHFIVDDAGERRQGGPVTTEALASMASLEEIAGDSLVWREGMADWLPLCEVPEFSRLFHQVEPPHTGEPESSIPTEAATTEDEAGATGPPDVVTLRDFDNHSVQFSRSRNRLLVVANDYHAGPLELTKLDLLEFLTAMERAAGEAR